MIFATYDSFRVQYAVCAETREACFELLQAVIHRREPYYLVDGKPILEATLEELEAWEPVRFYDATAPRAWYDDTGLDAQTLLEPKSETPDTTDYWSPWATDTGEK